MKNTEKMVTQTFEPTEEELYGHEQDCPCKPCTATREFQRQSKNTILTDAFWCGMMRFHKKRLIDHEVFLKRTGRKWKWSVRQAYLVGNEYAAQGCFDGTKAYKTFQHVLRKSEQRKNVA